MLKTAMKVLDTITSHGYQAYIVGGFVRDHLLGIDTNDIDMNTDATPQELQKIFKEIDLTSEDYGTVVLTSNTIRFEITTFRKEIGSINNRRPIKIEYVDNLYDDLQRRDFTINTICMNQKQEIIDLLNGREDLEAKIIRTVGNAKTRFEEDSLRILRAIRFATSLGFNLSEDVQHAIFQTKHLLKNLSYQRKKEELDKIFAHSNVKRGIELLLEFNLDDDLELPKLREINNTDSLISVWSILDVLDKYPFNNGEKELIKKINKVLPLNNLDPKVLYEYGLYINSVAAAIKGIDKKTVTQAYNNLIIQSRTDLDITSQDIMNLLKKPPGKYLSDIYSDIENKVLYQELENKKNKIEEYILEKY